jgi:hypothetical protein
MRNLIFAVALCLWVMVLPARAPSALNNDLKVGDNSDNRAGTIGVDAPCNAFANARCLNQFSGLQAAHDDLPSKGGVIIVPPNYTDTETATVNITKPGVSIICMGRSEIPSAITINHAGAGLHITGAYFRLQGCDLNVGTAASRTNVPLIDAAVQGGSISEVRFGGNASSPNNGIAFSSSGSGFGAGMWTLRDVLIWQGVWTSFVSITNGNNSHTAADFHLFNVVTQSNTKFTDAGVVLDGKLDTVAMVQLTVLNGGPGTALYIRNTVGASPGFPRWVHCNDCYLEAGGNTGGTGLKIDGGRDVQYRGYIASASTGAAITGSSTETNGIDLSHIVFTNIGRSAITLPASANRVKIADNNFDDICNQVTNTYDGISVAANASEFSITGNMWRNNGAKKCRYGVNVAPGASNSYLVAMDEFSGGTFGTNYLNDGGSGTSKYLMGGLSTTPNSIGLSGDAGVSSSPRMTWSGFHSTPVNVQSFGLLVPDRAITITRLTGGVLTPPTGCATFPVYSVFDNSTTTALVNVTPTKGANLDSGAVSINVPAGHPLLFRVTTGASGCATNPANLSLTMEYKMQ